MSNRSQFSIKISRCIAIALTVVVIAGCGSRDASAIKFGLATPPVTLDPRFATDATSYRIIRLLYQALVDFDELHQPIPSLATWQRVTPLHYRFAIKPAQTFHDGRAVTSADVLATYRSILDEQSASPHRGSLTNVASIDAPDPLVVEFKLHKPDPLFPGLLVIGILPVNVVEAGPDGVVTPLGSGPFRVTGSVSETRLRLERISDGQVVEFITVRDATVRALKLLHAEIDLMQGSMTPELVDWLDRREGISAHHRPGTTFTYLGFNLDDKLLSNTKLRHAIAHAIDRNSLTKYMFGGRARLANAIFPGDHWVGNPTLEPIEYNPSRARELLAELGYDTDRRLQLNYKTSSDHFRLRIATVIQDQLANVGVQVTISSYDWGTFYADVKAGRFQMYSLSWVGLKLPDIFRYAFHSESIPPVGANRGRYRSTRVDQLIEAAEAKNEVAERSPLYREVQQQVLLDLPYVPLWYEGTTVVQRDSIAGYTTGLDGYYDGLNDVQRTPR